VILPVFLEVVEEILQRIHLFFRIADGILDVFCVEAGVLKLKRRTPMLLCYSNSLADRITAMLCL
jgi:hypothetical protein